MGQAIRVHKIDADVVSPFVADELQKRRIYNPLNGAGSNHRP